MSQRFETRRFTAPAWGVDREVERYGHAGWIEFDRKTTGTADDGSDLVRVLLKRPLPDPVRPAGNEASYAH